MTRHTGEQWALEAGDEEPQVYFCPSCLERFVPETEDPVCPFCGEDGCPTIADWYGEREDWDQDRLMRDDKLEDDDG